jgi:class 3 adenylate cyclase/tetratricopeptide (TPR) repeat protein
VADTVTRFVPWRDGELASNQSTGGPFDGERKFATVLFADVAQSSRLIVDNDPEDADEHLLGMLQIMIDAVHRYGGTVNQVLGDGVMALFGVPRAQEDHALRACLAAEAIHAMTRQLESRRSSPGDSVKVRVGLGSGELVIKTPQSEFDLKYRAVGEAVYLAHRMESAAPPGTTLLGRATLNLAAEQVQARPFGAVCLKADSNPVEALELVEVKVDKRSSQRLSHGGSSLFIGRTRDLDALHGDLDGVASGAGRAVVISGDAGVGKSRLLYEFLERVGNRRCQIMTCDLLPSGLARTLDASARIVKGLLPDQMEQGAQNLRGAIGDWLDTLRIDGRYALPAIMELLGMPAEDSDWAELEPPERLQAVVETVGKVVSETSRRKPLVLAFEDFHWADSETSMLVDELAANISSSRVLLIVTSRSHHEKAWESWPGATEREIRPLSKSQTGALLEALLGPDPELEELKQLLAEKTQGNPFFLEECVRALEEAGSLAGATGAYRLVVPVRELEIPGTVHGALAARVDSLSAPERATLFCASVIGQRVDVGLLRNLCPQPREELLARLSRLQQAGFLERTRIMPNLEYSFRHALIHDVAYNTLLKRKRRELHAQVMAAVERRPAALLPCKVELVAHHAFHAEDWPKAFAYCRRAGQRAQAKSANREAVDFFGQALQAAERNPRTRRHREREIDVRLELVQSLFPLGRHDEGLRQLLAAQKLASDLADERRLGNIAASLVLSHWVRGDLARAIRTGRKALAMAGRLGDSNCEIQVATRLGAIYLDRGDYRSACELLKAGIEKISGRDSYDRFGLLAIASVASRASLARALGELGRFEEAIRVGDEGVRIAEETGHVFSQIYAYLFVGNALLRKGDFQRGLQPLSHSYDLCKATRAKLLLPLSAASLGYAHVRMGKISRGLELLERATMAARQHVIKFQLAQELTWLGEAYVLANNYERALGHARNALDYAEKNGEKGDEAWALWLLGEIHARLDSSQARKAEEYLLRALDIAAKHFMGPLVAHIDFGLGKLYRRQRAWNEAQSQFESAMSLYRDLGMNYWLETTEAELAHERQRVPAPLALR